MSRLEETALSFKGKTNTFNKIVYIIFLVPKEFVPLPTELEASRLLAHSQKNIADREEPRVAPL